jgi:hypothetical protein
MLGATQMKITTKMNIKTYVQRIQDLRRSNAAQPVRNKKKYIRKIKHKNKITE